MIKVDKLHAKLDFYLGRCDLKNEIFAPSVSNAILDEMIEPECYISIFKGAFVDPYRHAMLTFKVGAIASQLNSGPLKAVYQAMLKIQRTPETTLPNVPEVQWQIIQGLITGKDNCLDFEQTEKIRHIFYGFTQKYFWSSFRKGEFPHLKSNDPEQEKINMRNYWQAMATATTFFKTLLPFANPYEIAPYLCRYNFKQFRGYNEPALLKSTRNLSSVYLEYKDSIGDLPFPERIFKFGCASLLNTCKKGRTLEKFTHIRELKLGREVNYLIKTLPHPEKLVRLSCFSCPDEILRRLENIEILEMTADEPCNLSLLPHPHKLKHMHLNAYALTEELMSSFVNLESFRVPRVNTEKIMTIVSTSKIRTLIFDRHYEIVGKDYPPSPSIETVCIKGAKGYLFNTASIMQKFPQLKCLKIRPESISDQEKKKLAAAHIHLIEE